MAVIGPRSSLRIALLLLAAAVFPIHADQSADLRRKLSDIATALATGNPAQAMDCFDRESFDGYDKLSAFFQSLTGAYQVDSRIDVTDEESEDNSAGMTVHWVLTLTDPATNLDQHREADINVKLTRKKGAWRIVAFAPIEIFDPQMKR